MLLSFPPRKWYESPLLLAENDSAQYFAFIAMRYVYVLPILFGSFIMVKDLVLLCGSIKQKKGALIAVAIMEAITILCLFVRFTITFNGFVDVDSIKFPDSIKIPLILFASYKLWNILVILGAIQQVKKKMINQRQEIATEMS